MESDKQRIMEMLTGADRERRLGDEEVQTLAVKVSAFKRTPRSIDVGQHGITVDFTARPDELADALRDLLSPDEERPLELDLLEVYAPGQFPPGIVLPEEYILRYKRALKYTGAQGT